MKVTSVCPFCGVGCGIEIEVKNGKVVRILPQKNHPISEGGLCIKVTALPEIINSPQRLKYPLIKKNGQFKKISWEKAINKIAKEFTRIIATYGRNAIGIIASTKCTNEENYLIQKFARVVIGTNNVDNSTRLCHAPTTVGMYETLGKSAMTNSFNDLTQSDCILIFGDNPAATQPMAFEKIAKCRSHGGKIVVIDVRKSETAERADIFVQINPNTDALLIAGLAKVILEKKLADRKFIKNCTKGFTNFKKSLEKIKMEKIVEITGVDKEKIEKIATMYAKGRGAIVFGMGITQQQNGIENVLALINLALLTGNIGKSGTGLNPLRGCNNVTGACDVGCLPNVYPGYTSLTRENIRKFEKMWGIKGLPITKGLTEYEMIEGIPERILAMYIIGQNPLLSLPNSNRVEKNLRNLEFLVVQDIFMTETAELADIILPAACFAEKTGTFTNTERRVQLIKRAVNPPPEVLEDWQIIKAIAEKMGYKEQFNYSCAEDIFKEMCKVMKIYSGMSYKKLEKQGIQWPCDKKRPTGTQILSFDRRIPFYPISYIGPEALIDYPFVMICHRYLEQYNTGTMTRKSSILNKIKPKAIIEINENDARNLKIKNGEKIKISSPFGMIIAEAKISDRIKQGIVAAPTHYGETIVNRLTSSLLDSISKTPAFKYCRVKIEKI